MTKDEALKLALKFVEDSECGTADLEVHIKKALAQPEQESQIAFNPEVIGYIAPQRTWVELPTIVILNIYAETLKTHRGGSMPEGQIVFAQAIEQALKERNT